MTERLLLCVLATSPDPVVLESVRRQSVPGVDVDVVVLDETGDSVRSEQLARACEELGLLRYRSPRRLGTTRAANLALRAALAAGHRDVVLTQGDGVLAAGTVERLRAAARRERSAVVMAWSDDGGEYGLECAEPDALRADPSLVDAIGDGLADNFGEVVFDVPTAPGGCVLVPTEAVEQVGLLDPVLQDHASALTDWSLRARSHGRRVSLAPSTFVARPARPAPGHAAWAAAQLGSAVVDQRYPQHRDQLVAFRASGLVAAARVGAGRRLMIDGARRDGYSIEVGWVVPAAEGTPLVRCLLAPEPAETVRCEYRGFTFTLGLEPEDDPVAVLADLLGGPPREANLYDRGRVASDVAVRTGVATDRYSYPTRI